MNRNAILIKAMRQEFTLLKEDISQHLKDIISLIKDDTSKKLQTLESKEQLQRELDECQEIYNLAKIKRLRLKKALILAVKNSEITKLKYELNETETNIKEMEQEIKSISQKLNPKQIEM